MFMHFGIFTKRSVYLFLAHLLDLFRTRPFVQLQRLSDQMEPQQKNLGFGAQGGKNVANVGGKSRMR